MPAGVRHADLSVRRTAACSPSARPTRPRAARPTSSTRSSGSTADGHRGAGQRPRLRLRPAAGARRRHAVLAAVGPPVHAVGRRAARRPRRRRRRARDGRRPRRVGRAAGVGRGPGAVVARRPHDFWSLYRRRPHGEAELVLDVGSDIAGPQWVFGQSRFALLADGRVAFAYGRDGADRLAVLEADGSVRELDRAVRVLPVRCAAPGDGGRLRGRRPGERAGGAPGRRRRRRRRRCCARPATSAWTRPGSPAPSTSPSRPRTRGTGIDVGARAGLPAHQPGGHRPGRRPARRCWWSSTAGPPSAAVTGAEPGRPVLDLPRVLRRRRRLPRARPATAAGTATRCRAAGASSTSTTSSRAPATSPTRAGSTPPGWRSAAARPAATRRWPR